MNAVEMRAVDGGTLPKAKYACYSFTNTDNELIYAAEALLNGGKLIYNGAATVWNWATCKFG